MKTTIVTHRWSEVNSARDQRLDPMFISTKSFLAVIVSRPHSLQLLHFLLLVPLFSSCSHTSFSVYPLYYHWTPTFSESFSILFERNDHIILTLLQIPPDLIPFRDQSLALLDVMLFLILQLVQCLSHSRHSRSDKSSRTVSSQHCAHAWLDDSDAPPRHCRSSDIWTSGHPRKLVHFLCVHWTLKVLQSHCLFLLQLAWSVRRSNNFRDIYWLVRPRCKLINNFYAHKLLHHSEDHIQIFLTPVFFFLRTPRYTLQKF